MGEIGKDCETSDTEFVKLPPYRRDIHRSMEPSSIWDAEIGVVKMTGSRVLEVTWRTLWRGSFMWHTNFSPTFQVFITHFVFHPVFQRRFQVWEHPTSRVSRRQWHPPWSAASASAPGWVATGALALAAGAAINRFGSEGKLFFD